MVALGHGGEALSFARRQQQELCREKCRDEDGNRYTVIVWRSFPGLPTTYYTLEDGTPVVFGDECIFTIVPTGEQLTRCDE